MEYLLGIFTGVGIVLIILFVVALVGVAIDKATTYDPYRDWDKEDWDNEGRVH